MTTQGEIINHCLTHMGAYEDHPFRINLDYCVVRHGSGGKVFALIFQKDGKPWVNLKVEPIMGDFLKQAYPAVVPAYHMNKTHWISVILDGSVPDADIHHWVTTSYDLTAKKRK